MLTVCVATLKVDTHRHVDNKEWYCNLRPHLLRVAADAGLLADVGVGFVQEVRRIRACLGQNPPCQAVGLLQERLHQVLCLHYLVAALHIANTMTSVMMETCQKTAKGSHTNQSQPGATL